MDARSFKLDRKSALVLGGFILLAMSTLWRAKWALGLLMVLGFGYAVWSWTGQ